MPDKTSVPSSGATDAFRGVFFFVSSTVIVITFLLQALPLGMFGRVFAVASAAAYRTGFFAGAVAHGYRVVYTLRPKLAASTGWMAAAPTLSREVLASNSFLYTLYCLLFLTSRPTGLALLPVAFTALLQALTYLVSSRARFARRTPRPLPLTPRAADEVPAGVAAVADVRRACLRQAAGVASYGTGHVRLDAGHDWHPAARRPAVQKPRSGAPTAVAWLRVSCSRERMCCWQCATLPLPALLRADAHRVASAGQDVRVLEHHPARLLPLRRRHHLPHEAPRILVAFP